MNIKNLCLRISVFTNILNFLIIISGCFASISAFASELIAKDDKGNETFRVIPAYSMIKVPREQSLNNVWQRWNTSKIALTAAKDETESFQLVIIPGNNGLQKVSIKAGDLHNGKSKIKINTYYVEYVRTIKPKNTKPAYVGWWPDVLVPMPKYKKTFDVPAGRQEPIWFAIDVPPNSKSGNYVGKISIIGDGVKVDVSVTLNVYNFRLPRPGTLACAFGLYPATLKNWYGIADKQNPSACPIEMFAKWCEFLGQYRLTPKNIGREYWIRKPDGTISLERLKQTVGALSGEYYPPYSFAIYRLPNPDRIMKGEDKKDIDKWISDIKAGLAEYRRLNFPREVFLYGMDEASEKSYPLVKETYSKIKQAFPDLPIMQTLNHAPPEKLAGLVDIWCPLSPRLEEKFRFYQERKKAGDIVWMYVCCVPCETYANFFIDEPGIDHRILFWQVWQKGATGLLYWSTTWWQGLSGVASGKCHFPDVPIYMRDTVVAQKLKNNGDGLLIWPGPNATPYPSIRLEIIRDGIEDYEYLAMLRRYLNQAEKLSQGKRPSKSVLEAGRSLINVPKSISRRFNDFCDNPKMLLSRREKIAKMIETLRSYFED